MRTRQGPRVIWSSSVPVSGKGRSMGIESMAMLNRVLRVAVGLHHVQHGAQHPERRLGVAGGERGPDQRLHVLERLQDRGLELLAGRGQPDDDAAGVTALVTPLDGAVRLN